MDRPTQRPTREFPGVRSESPRIRRFPSYLPVTGLRVSSLAVSGQTLCDFCDSEFVRECVTARSAVCPVSVRRMCVYLCISLSPAVPRLRRCPGFLELCAGRAALRPLSALS